MAIAIALVSAEATLVIVALIFILTEKRLTTMFDRDGNRISN